MARTLLLCSLLLTLTLAALGCAPGSSSPAGAGADAALLLRDRFPNIAPGILETHQPFAAVDRRFVAPRPEGAGGWSRMNAELPADAAEPARLWVSDDFEIRLFETGIHGQGALAEGAVVYERQEGFSYWTAGSGGLEEWLLVRAGDGSAGQVVAEWEIEGAELQAYGEAVQIVDESGRVRMSVTAPMAYFEDGTEVPARLTTSNQGTRLELRVDAPGAGVVLVDPAWSSVASMSTARNNAAAALLPNGKVLVTGGHSGGVNFATTEQYDPATNAWSAAPSMSYTHVVHTMTPLQNGKVLVAGGLTDKCEVYDPVANSWTVVASMTAIRTNHRATLLQSGKILVSGGIINGSALATAEVYDPAANTWTPTGPLGTARSEHAAVLLLDGRVLVAGGFSGTYLQSAEVYSPATNTWTATPQMNGARDAPTASLLPNGKVLVVGGFGSTGSSEIYDPVANTWGSVASMAPNNHGGHGIVKLANGFFLAIGGGTAACDAYNPSTNTWTASPPLITARYNFSYPVLQNNTVLAIGGLGTNNVVLASCELFKLDATGSACTSAAGCLSGFCTDGYCCDTACNTPCVACSAAKKGAGSNGTCGNVAAGTDPDNDCLSQNASTCGLNGSCNGAASCQLYSNGTVCSAASCSGTLLYKTDLCNGTGTCVDGGTQECAPFACSAGACLASCSADGQCASTAYCSAPSCLPKKATGQPCSGASQCQTGLCIDGVCCGTSCNGTCFACSAAKKGLGPDGACGPILAGLDPDAECPSQSASTCGTTGFCNGAGACGLHPSGTICNTATCNGTVLSSADLCNGSGTCVDGGIQKCAPFACAAGACLSSCTGDNDCAPTAYCSGAVCLPKKPVGGSCAAIDQCQSGFCADGVCCDTACDGICSACSAAKKGAGADGTCELVFAGADPDADCTDEGAASCGQNGWCDGSGACQKYLAGVVCVPASCDGTQQNTAGVCDGVGACLSGMTVECAPFACSMGACLDVCIDNSECASDAFCDGGMCVPDLAGGSACAGVDQCQSGFCVDGVCCDSECSGTCVSCAAAKKGSGVDGVCEPVAGGSDPDEDCADEDATTCGHDGTCDGSGACALYSSGTECAAASCEGSILHPASLCDGMGTCAAPEAKDCAPGWCDVNACVQICTTDLNCDEDAYCDGGQCAFRLPLGAPCDADHTCHTGFCVDDVCCEGECEGECSACSAQKKGAGVDGTCGPIAVGTDPDNECKDEGPLSCGTDGDCSGSGSCEKYTQNCAPDGGAEPSGDRKSFYACAAGPAPGDPDGLVLLTMFLSLMALRLPPARKRPA